jgi:flagellar biosynthetic protein FlhB
VPEQQGERSQDPTPHRRQKAREEGHTARSQDLTSAVLLLVGMAALLMSGGAMIDFLGSYTQRQLGGEAWLSADLNFALVHWNDTAWEVARHVLPILAALLIAAVVVNFAQVGFLFLPQKLAPDLARLDPIKGLGRIFSLAGAMRLAFGLFKVLVVGVVVFVSLYNQRDTILGLSGLELSESALYLAEVLVWTTIKVAAALLVLAILDFGFQRWKHEQDLKMTTQEVREEMKNLEGDPQIAARRRAVQRQLVLNRLSSAVPKADVVVTNPTELAVAIQYEPATMAAPIVVAKGAGLLAQRIRRLALEHGIPIVEKKPLAQALYRDVEVNHPIPQDKYAAVAELLAYVYQLRGSDERGVKRRE